MPCQILRFEDSDEKFNKLYKIVKSRVKQGHLSDERASAKRVYHGVYRGERDYLVFGFGGLDYVVWHRFDSELKMDKYKWYAIQTYVGSEMAVKRAIENLVKDNAISEQLKEIVVPTEDVIEFKGGKEKISQRCLYSGYVFANLDLDTALWHKIQSLPRVGRFIGESKKPTPLSEQDINLILEKAQNRAAPRLKIDFEKGENVRIREGSFANFTGIVEEYDMVSGKLKLNVSIFGRSTPVEVECAKVEKII